MRTFCLIVSLSVLSLASGCVKEDNVVYYGNDIPGKNKIVIGLEECIIWCGETTACRYWTFAKSAKRCYLKTSDSNRKEDSDRISGTKNCGSGCVTENNVVYYGNDIPGKNKIVSIGLEECIKWCGETTACRYWTFAKSSKRCYLKTSDSTRKEDSDRISGTKNCGSDDNSVLSWLNHFRKLHYADQISELDPDLTREALKAGKDNCWCLRTSQGLNHHPCGPGVQTGKHGALGECKFDKCGSREAAIVATLKNYHEKEADVYCRQKFYSNPPSDAIGIGHFTAMVWKGATKYGLWAYKCEKRRSWIVAMSPNSYNIAGQYGSNVGRPRTCSHSVEASFSGSGLSSGSVVCGNHRATSCSACTKDAPKFKPASWCNGDCEWVRNSCRKRN